LELAILRAFCASVPAAQDTLSRLANYSWQDEEHRVVYESLRAALRHPADRLREEMAAEATRMGHPDVDWELYFQPAGLADMEAIIGGLLMTKSGI
jgi:hypothetical protein